MKKQSQTPGIVKILAISLMLFAMGKDLMSQVAGFDFLKSLPANEIITARVQVGNNTWISTCHGLYIISEKSHAVAHFTNSNSALPSSCVTGICMAPGEKVYVSTDKGILRYDGYDYQSITTENADLPTTNITSIACDKDGYVWMGTKDKGVVMMFNYKCHTYNCANSVLTNNSVTHVSTDGHDNIFIALANGDVVLVNEKGMKLQEKISMMQNKLMAKK